MIALAAEKQEETRNSAADERSASYTTLARLKPLIEP
jgi:hypothetical protein